jgi:hypothetical protein
MELLTLLVILFAFAPIALRHLAPDWREHVVFYRVLSLVQIAVSGFFVSVLPLREFLMAWAWLPAAIGLWDLAKDAVGRRRTTSPRPDGGSGV